MNRLIFILGGAKSGKSRFALEYGSTLGSQKIYIATAQPLDPEMEQKIEIHRRERTADWKTLEEPLDLAAALKSIEGTAEVAVVDCLTLWLNNLLKNPALDDRRIMEAFERFLAAARSVKPAVIVISNEVGQGIVPADPLSRRFRDLSGFLHQRIAQAAHEVYWITAGIAVPIKKGGFHGVS